MKKRIFTFLFIISSFCCWTNAQRSYGGFPLAESSASSLRSLTNDEWVEMPPFDISMVQKDSSQIKIGGLQFAHAFKTQLTPQNCGERKILSNGSKLWRVKIRSTDALSINLIFNKFQLKGNSKLFLYFFDTVITFAVSKILYPSFELLSKYFSSNNLLLFIFV